MSAVASTGNLTLMASRQSAAKKPPAKKAAAPTKAPAKKAPAKKAAAKKAPAKKAAAKKTAPPKPAPNPTGGVYKLVRAVWLGAAHAVGAVFRGIGQGAKNLDPAHRKDGVALLLLALALIVAAGTWSHLRGPVGDLVPVEVDRQAVELVIDGPELVADRRVAARRQEGAGDEVVARGQDQGVVVGVVERIHDRGEPGRLVERVDAGLEIRCVENLQSVAGHVRPRRE